MRIKGLELATTILIKRSKSLMTSTGEECPSISIFPGLSATTETLKEKVGRLAGMLMVLGLQLILPAMDSSKVIDTP